MAKQLNALLADMRSTGVHMSCERVYTDELKDGRFRVKLHGRRNYSKVELVEKLGTSWKNITVKQLRTVTEGVEKPHYSVVVYAEKVGA